MNEKTIKGAVMDAPATTASVKSVSPSLLRNEVDRRLVKIRPMATPLDQISRHATFRNSGSMVVDYYSVDTKPTSCKVRRWDIENAEALEGSSPLYKLTTVETSPLQATETLLVPGYTVRDSNGVDAMLILYVVSSDSSVATVMPVNQADTSVAITLDKDMEVIRMGRAATELDVQTPQFQAIPVKSSNFCQIFKAQVEQSTLVKLSNKEVGWDFNDQEEAAVIDMRLGMEKNFLFGHKTRFVDPVKGEEVILTNGIWNQTSHAYTYDKSMVKMSSDTLVEIMREAFTKNAGSSRKVLIGGSGFIQRLHSVEADHVVRPDNIVTKWGIDFTELHSKFGTLYVVLSEVFDQCGRADDAIVIDPEYVTKYAHIPFRTEKLNLRQSGVRNTDAIVITEASCLVLRYPDAHLKIMAK